MKYTFTFGKEEENNFKRVMSRLEPEEYTVIKDVYLVKEDDPRYSDREAILEMDPEAALTFRLGMKHVKIRRERTEEELAAEKEREDRHTVTIRVIMPTEGDDSTPSP